MNKSNISAIHDGGLLKASLLLLAILANHLVCAQDISSIGKEKPVALSGSLSSTNIFYGSFGSASRRDPFSYFLSGSLNISLYGLDIPLSINYSNQQTTFYQPFNQYGLSPTYQWVTAHLGWRSMNFSSYTLAGHTFLGAGVEMNPAKWRFSAMHGRLNKAVAYDTTNQRGTLPAYERYGTGLKIGYGSATDYVDLIMFRAQDHIGSIISLPQELNILPGENLVFGVNLAKSITKRLSFSGEWAGSAYTRDMRAAKADLAKAGMYSRIGNLFTPRTSSSYYQAFKSTLQYAGNQYSLNVGYERVDPGYQTMGAYFFNNDLENMTAGVSTQMLKSKVSLATNMGIQRNNLEGDKVNSQNRLISSVNLGYAPAQAWNFSGSYSNFTTNTRRAPRLNEIINSTDTLSLEYVQVTDNANFSAGYNGKRGEDTYAVNVNLSYQAANERQGQLVTDRQSRFYNGNLGYSYHIAAMDLGISTSMNLNRNDDPDFSNVALGPALAFNKPFYDKKLRTTLSTAYNTSIVSGENAGHVMNTRLNTNYSLNKNNFTFSLVMLNRNVSGISHAFTEMTGTISYSYSF